MNGKREFGDYQTPLSFTGRICSYLSVKRNIKPLTVIEPTCGIGNFLKSSLIFNADKYYGIEINSKYCEYCQQNISDRRVNIINGDIFSFDFKNLIDNISNILIIGNPPWVTNSTLSILGSNNLPVKTNFKNFKGLEAITGASNFDVCEYIILQLINEFRNTDTTIAMLCKTSVARNVFAELKRNNIYFKYCDLLEFDAYKIFGINANACVLLVKLSKEYAVSDICNVYSIDDGSNIKYSFGYINNRLFSNIKNNNYDFDGNCCFEWRQGIKHDCSKIMELSKEGGALYNGKKELVDIEDTILFPLVKSSMFKKPVINNFSKYVLVTQKKIREETSYIAKLAPKTWAYLNKNKDWFNKRKSSIYNGAPEFSMFGIGSYSYSKYKTGISGFYKKPLFSVLFSPSGKPVMTDDTSYFICFGTYNMAYVAMLLLNSNPVQDFLVSIAFLDAKRPYTKNVLKRLDFKKILSIVQYEELKRTEKNLGLKDYITIQMYKDFKNLPDLNK